MEQRIRLRGETSDDKKKLLSLIGKTWDFPSQKVVRPAKAGILIHNFDGGYFVAHSSGKFCSYASVTGEPENINDFLEKHNLGKYVARTKR